MAKIRVFDFLLTAAALTALFLLLPADKETKIARKEYKNSTQLRPANSGNPKIDYQQPTHQVYAREV